MKTGNHLWFIKHFILIATVVIVCVVPIWNSFVQTAHKNASKGVLDLRDTEIEHVEPIQLIGEWKFYWKKWVNQVNHEQTEHGSSFFVFVPNSWTKYSLHENALPQQGYATYQLSILVNEQDVGKIVSLYISNVATAYRLWVGDELIASNGKVAAAREHMIPKNYAKVATFQIKQPTVELFLQVSNYHQRKSGLWEPITFGTAEEINKLRDRNVLFQSFVIGCIFMIGIYQLMLFIHRPKERVSLYIAIACFCISLRTSLLKDTLLVHLFPRLNWEWMVSIEYLSGLIALLFFLFYVDQEFALQLPKRLKQWLVISLLLYCLFIVFFPARIYTNTFTLLQVIVSFILLIIVVAIIKGYRQQREGSSLNVIAFILLSAAIINDLLYYRLWISTDEFVSLGLLFYLLAQSIHVARKFSHSFDQAERLSNELQQLNESLEKKIAARTEQLEKMYRRLQKIEDSRRRLFSSVSHELKTPLTFIQGYIKAMMDGVVPKDDSTYLRSVYSDTQMMAHMIRDLQELSKLESGQIRFEFEKINIHSYFHRLYLEQKRTLEEKGYRFEFQATLPEKVVCRIDPMRIKQVYLNLIVNAQKFTPVGGTITLKIEFFDASTNDVKVSVIDSGYGISKEALPHIFERFYKEHFTQNGTERGAGLGLAIAKEIIEQHGGTIGVNSVKGKGSVFYFTLPIEIKTCGDMSREK